MSEIVAPATAAPVESLTCPEIVPAVWALEHVANAITTARATALKRKDVRLGRTFGDPVRVNSKELLSALPEKMGGVRRREMALRTSRIAAVDLRIACDLRSNFGSGFVVACQGTRLNAPKDTFSHQKARTCEAYA